MDITLAWILDPRTPLWLETEGKKYLRAIHVEMLVDFVHLTSEAQLKGIRGHYPALKGALDAMGRVVDQIHRKRWEAEQSQLAWACAPMCSICMEYGHVETNCHDWEEDTDTDLEWEELEVQSEAEEQGRQGQVVDYLQLPPVVLLREGEEPLPHSQPEGEEPLLPSQPEGEEPVPPSQPEGEEPLPPSQPEEEEPLPPLQPEGEEPLPPLQPEGEEPLPPLPLRGEEQELPLPPPPPLGAPLWLETEGKKYLRAIHVEMLVDFVHLTSEAQLKGIRGHYPALKGALDAMGRVVDQIHRKRWEAEQSQLAWACAPMCSICMEYGHVETNCHDWEEDTDTDLEWEKLEVQSEAEEQGGRGQVVDYLQQPPVVLLREGEEPLPHSQPEGEEPLLPSQPEGEEPVPPSQPEGEEPLPPSQPEGEEPLPPLQPEGEEPLPPSQPEGEEPLPPLQPEGEEPLPPLPLRGEEQELPLPPPPPLGEVELLLPPSWPGAPLPTSASPGVACVSFVSPRVAAGPASLGVAEGPLLPPSPPEGPLLAPSPGFTCSPSSEGPVPLPTSPEGLALLSAGTHKWTEGTLGLRGRPGVQQAPLYRSQGVIMGVKMASPDRNPEKGMELMLGPAGIRWQGRQVGNHLPVRLMFDRARLSPNVPSHPPMCLWGKDYLQIN
ncbi:UNVERIFIED_CONTAM: hypothetical protein FKN15_044279 [Acipenser sinensis]